MLASYGLACYYISRATTPRNNGVIMLKQLSEPEIRLELEAMLPDLLPQAKLDEYCITREQEQNLRILVVGLERMLPTHEDKFDMSSYAEVNCYDQTRKATLEHPCQTAACAVGYAPSCGIYFDRNEYVCFKQYSEDNFGGVNSENEQETINQFMFSGAWGMGQNQMREAIARIKIVLAGKVPEKFNYRGTYA